MKLILEIFLIDKKDIILKKQLKFWIFFNFSFLLFKQNLKTKAHKHDLKTKIKRKRNIF